MALVIECYCNGDGDGEKEDDCHNSDSDFTGYDHAYIHIRVPLCAHVQVPKDM